MRFVMIYKANGVEHRRTRPNEQRMNRMVKDATVKHFGIRPVRAVSGPVRASWLEPGQRLP